jgi:hypothetical protein
VFKKILIALLINFEILAVLPVTSQDMWLIQIASNTLSSLRDLKEIITETREFNEQFEYVHGKVKQAVWRADRLSLWMQDLHDTSQIPVENLDTFNIALIRLKSSSREIKRLYIETMREDERAKFNLGKNQRVAKRSKMRAVKYSTEVKTQLDVKQAQIDSANTLKDIAVEMATLNNQIAELKTSVENTNSQLRRVEQEKIRKDILQQQKNKRIRNGVFVKKTTGVKS